MRKNKKNIDYINELLNQIKNKNKKQNEIAKMIGVSNENIRKWCKKFKKMVNLNVKNTFLLINIQKNIIMKLSKNIN